MNKEQTEAMLDDILKMLSDLERGETISGPLAICLYHLTEDIVHKHLHAAFHQETKNEVPIN